MGIGIAGVVDAETATIIGNAGTLAKLTGDRGASLVTNDGERLAHGRGETVHEGKVQSGAAQGDPAAGLNDGLVVPGASGRASQFFVEIGTRSHGQTGQVDHAGSVAGFDVTAVVDGNGHVIAGGRARARRIVVGERVFASADLHHAAGDFKRRS